MTDASTIDCSVMKRILKKEMGLDLMEKKNVDGDRLLICDVKVQILSRGCCLVGRRACIKGDLPISLIPLRSDDLRESNLSIRSKPPQWILAGTGDAWPKDVHGGF
jgi:hypothetical protein